MCVAPLSILDEGLSDPLFSMCRGLSPQDLMALSSTCQEMHARIADFASHFWQELKSMETSSKRLENLLIHADTLSYSNIQKIGYLFRRVQEDYDQLYVEDQQACAKPQTLEGMVNSIEVIQRGHASSLLTFAQKLSQGVAELAGFLTSQEYSRSLNDGEKAEKLSQWMYSNKRCFEHVIDFDLSQNDLSRIPPQIEGLKNLKTLKLNGCNLGKISHELLKLRSLEKLELMRNFALTQESYVLRKLLENGCEVIEQFIPPVTYDSYIDCIVDVLSVLGTLIFLALCFILGIILPQNFTVKIC